MGLDKPIKHSFHTCILPNERIFLNFKAANLEVDFYLLHWSEPKPVAKSWPKLAQMYTRCPHLSGPWTQLEDTCLLSGAAGLLRMLSSSMPSLLENQSLINFKRFSNVLVLFQPLFSPYPQRSPPQRFGSGCGCPEQAAAAAFGDRLITFSPAACPFPECPSTTRTKDKLRFNNLFSWWAGERQTMTTF